jgi:hypothetical protein
MKLPRPYIPLAVRVAVAERQYWQEKGISDEVWQSIKLGLTQEMMLKGLLEQLFGTAEIHLDHDPALCNRKFNPRTGQYTPDANDPDFLIYRPVTDHNLKTRVRGDGAQLSDLALRRKFKRIEKRKRAGKRPKYGGRA